MRGVDIRRGVLLGVLPVLVLIVAACSSSPTPTPTSTPSLGLTLSEEEYLGQVRAAWNLFRTKNNAFGEVFGQTWPVRGRLFEALKQAGAGTAFMGTLEALEELDPPPKFQADHQLLVDTVRELVRLDAEIIPLFDSQDAVAFVLLNTRLAEVSGNASLKMSGPVCWAGDPRSAPSDTTPPPGVPPGLPPGVADVVPLFSTCAPTEPLPGGEYGVRLNESIRRLEAFLSSLQSLGPFGLLQPDEVFQVAVQKAPKVIDFLEEILSDINALTPPSDLQSDHGVLTQYLTEAMGLTDAVGSAAQAGDMERFREELDRDRDVFCNARGGFSSPDFKKMVLVHFQGSPDT